LLSKSEVWNSAAILATTFQFQPSEIDNLDIDELIQWGKLALDQYKAANPG
jgi:hypothetical protein